MSCCFYAFTLGQSLYQVNSSQLLFLWLLVPSLLPVVPSVIFTPLPPAPSLARDFYLYCWKFRILGTPLMSEVKDCFLIEVFHGECQEAVHKVNRKRCPASYTDMPLHSLAGNRYSSVELSITFNECQWPLTKQAHRRDLRMLPRSWSDHATCERPMILVCPWKCCLLWFKWIDFYSAVWT